MGIELELPRGGIAPKILPETCCVVNRVAYDFFLGGKPTRSSWDQVALLLNVRPNADYWKLRTSLTLRVVAMKKSLTVDE